MTAQERIIKIAEEQVGYMGKKTNAQLDDFTSNAGGRYNKFARDLDAITDFYNGKKNGYDWCDVFVDWCFITAFGMDMALKLTCQPKNSCGAGTGYSLMYYRTNGRVFVTPEPGDQIFFGDSTSTWHTGIVTKVSGGYVHTIEGNAGNPSAVRSCKYAIGYKNIKGYGRPDWSLVPPETTSKEPINEEEDDMVIYKTINDVPTWYLAAVQKAVDKGALNGTGNGELNVSEDMCRVLTVLDRLGKLE